MTDLLGKLVLYMDVPGCQATTMVMNTIGLLLYMRPVNARVLAGPEGICGLTLDYVDGPWVPALP